MSSMMSNIQNSEMYQSAVAHYETIIQKVSTNPKFWTIVGVALIAIALVIVGLSMWGAAHLYTHTIQWNQLGDFGKFLEIYGSIIVLPFALCALSAITSPLFYVGGNILHKAMQLSQSNAQSHATEVDGGL